MSGPLQVFFEADHARLDALLTAARTGHGVELAHYGELRAGLLRHIGIEEKILLPAVRKLRAGQALPLSRQLRADHAALAALLVPTPTPELLGSIAKLLSLHNALEEGDQGLYAICEEILGATLAEILERSRSAPPVPLAPHHDGPRAFAAIERLLRSAGRDP